MEECLFSPGEYIFRQGQLDDCSIYYIVKGQVSILYEYEERGQVQGLVLSTLKKQQYFGDIELIQGNIRTVTAQANDFCRIYKIPRNSFFQIIKECDQDFENFKMIIEGQIFKESYKLSNIRCYTCKKIDHITIKCPKTHLTISKQTLINRENTSAPHLQREQHYKRNQQRFGALINNGAVLDGIYQILDKEENIMVLQQIEEDLHLSQDEAYLDECYQELYELEMHEIKTENIKQEQYKLESNQGLIKEAGQEEEDDKEDPMIDQNIYQDQNKITSISTPRTNNQQQNNDSISLGDVNSLTARSQSHQNKKGRKGHHLSIDKKRISSEEMKQAINVYQLQIPHQFEQESQIESNTQPNHNSRSQTSLSSSRSSSNSPQSKVSQVAILELQNQVHQIFYSVPNQNPINNLNVKTSKMNSMQSSELEPKKQKSDISYIQGSKESVLNVQKSKELNPSILYTASPNQTHIISISGNQLSQNNVSLDVPHNTNAEKPRKSQSLKCLQKLNQEQSNAKQQQLKLDFKQRVDQNNQLKKNKYSQQRNNSKNSEKFQLRRSQSFDQCTMNTIMKQLDEQSINNSNNLNRIATPQNIQIQNDTPNRAKHFQKQTSTSSIASHNKMRSNITNSQNPSLSSLGNHANHEIYRRQISNQQIQERGLIRSQSKKYSYAKALKPRSSINQGMIQGNLNYLINPNLKTQLNYLQQLNQLNNVQQQIQSNLENSQGLGKNQASNAINNITNNIQQQSSLTKFPQIAQLINLSPNIRQRRQNIPGNNLIKQQIQENILKNLLQNSLQLGGYEQRTSIADQFKKGSQMDILNKEFQKKINIAIKSETQIPSNLNLMQQTNIPLTNLIIQDDNMYTHNIDASYQMLQIFDKAKIYKYYYPNFNMNIVIQNLKQNDGTILSKHKQIRQRGVSRNTVQGKKHQRAPHSNVIRIDKPYSKKSSKEKVKNQIKHLE